MQLTLKVACNSCVCSYWGSYSLTIPGGSGAGNAVQLLTLPENAPEFFQFAAFKNGPLAAPTHPPALAAPPQVLPSLPVPLPAPQPAPAPLRVLQPRPQARFQIENQSRPAPRPLQQRQPAPAALRVFDKQPAPRPVQPTSAPAPLRVLEPQPALPAPTTRPAGRVGAVRRLRPAPARASKPAGKGRFRNFPGTAPVEKKEKAVVVEVKSKANRLEDREETGLSRFQLFRQRERARQLPLPRQREREEPGEQSTVIV